MLKDLKEALEPIGYQIRENDNLHFVISHCCIPYRIQLIKEEGFYYPIFYCRTHFGLGERTDLHEILPMVAALFFRATGRSSFRFLGEHNEWSGIEDELYGTYIFPSQPLSERIRSTSTEDLDEFIGILIGLVIIQNNLIDFLDVTEGKKETYSWEGSELNSWVNKIKDILGCEIGCTYNERENPTWYYFRSFSSGISVVKSKTIPRVIRKLYNKQKDTHECLKGVSSRLYLTGKIKNCVDNERYNLAATIINRLEGDSNIIVVPNENISFILGVKHIVAISNDGGISAFLDEKEKIKSRNARENKILFADKRMKWAIRTTSDSALFEDLVLELLAREPYILSAKKVAPTNQGDNGRDIICEYNANYNELRVIRQQPSIEVGQLIVQCKTNLEDSKKKSIGKADVHVADTVYDYKPDAYLLVVSSQITRDLTEYFEKIRARDNLHWIDWWNSFDIEERLRINPDIMSRYESIIGYE
ncbi:MAG: restriction endonuclease [Nitrospira sp.]|nr:restriction endonuclease [Nitrospira sp.]